MAGIKFDITSDNKNLLNSVRQAQTGVVNAINGIERAGMGIESTFSKIKGSILGGFTDIAKGMAGLTALMQGGSFIKDLIADAGKFNVAMKEVSTLSEDVANNLQGYKDKVVDMATQIPIKADEAAKALYQIESAGHHGADGLNVLRESAKGAIGGVTDTATTADAITTILNAYKKDASEAQHVSDLLFTTVRLGKTNMSQLGSTIAQVAPVAASFGVSIEDVLAAIASLTKQGTKTSVAVRQVRDAITATTKSMGDGAFQGRSFLDAMDEVAQKAQGSNNALRQDLGTLQALNAVLSLTGKNSKAARQDVADMQNSAGAAEAAYAKMASTAGTQTTLLRNNIFKAILPLADEMKSMSGQIAKSLNEAFDSGSMDKALASLEAFIAAYATYKGLLAATTAWNSAALGGTYQLQIAELQQLIPLKELEGQADLQAAVAKGTLTTEQAKLVASLRAETQARYEEVMAAETEARANLKALTAAEASATANLVAADEMVAAAQARVTAAMESGSAAEIEAAKEELNTAERLKNTAATELNTIQRQKNGAAIMVNVTEKNADTAAQLMDNVATGAGTKATGLLTAAKLQLNKAIKAVNSSFLASPLFWIAATIAAVTYAVYKLVTAENAHDAAIRRSNEAMDEAKKKLDERRASIDSLIRTIQDPNASAFEKEKAYDQLKQVASEITDAFSKEALAAMSAADAQKMLNESMDEAEFKAAGDRVEEWEKKVEDLTKRYEKYRKMADDGVDVGLAPDFVSKRQLEEAKIQLETYKAAYDKIVELRESAAKSIEEEAKPIEIRIQEAKSNEAEKQRIFNFYDEVMARVEDIQSSQNNLNFYEPQIKLEAYISEIQNELEKLHLQVQQNPLDQKLRMQENEKTDLLNKLLQWQADMHNGGFTTIPLFFKADWSSAQQALNQARGHYQSLANQTVANGAESLADLYNKAKSDFDKAAKEWKRVSNPKNRTFVTGEQYTKAKSDFDAKKTAYEAVGGDPDGKKAKAAAQAARQAKTQQVKEHKERAEAQAKQIQEELRYQDELRKIRQEASDARMDAEIASIKNTSQRERAEQDEQHQRNLRQIEEQANDMRKAIYEHNKKAWENTHKDSPYENTEAGKAGWMGLQLSEDQQAIIDALMQKENAEYLRMVEQRYDAERQATLDFLKEYGDYEQQKLAITQDYEKKIAEASTVAEKASLASSRDKELKELESKKLEDSIDWAGVFNDLSGHTKEYLEGLRDQLQKILATGNLPIDQMETIQGKIREINEAINEQGGMFAYANEQQREHVRRVEEAKNAQELYNQALAEQRGIEADITMAMNSLHTLLGDKTFDFSDMAKDQEALERIGKIYGKNSEEYKKAEKTLVRLRTQEGKLTEARENTQKRWNGWKKAEDGANEALKDSIARVAGNIKDWCNEFLGDLPELLSQIGLGSIGEKVGQGLSAVNNAAGAAADFASGNYVGAALKGLNAVKDFGRVLGIGGGNAAEINRQLERLSDRNEILTQSIDKLTDTMNGKGGAGAIKEYMKVAEMQKELEENLIKQMQLQMSYHSAHGSFNKYWGSGFSASEIDAFNKRHGTNWSGNLNDLTADLAALLMGEADMWQKINDTGKGGYGERVAEKIKELAEQAGKAKEQTAALYASLTAGTTRENVFDDFLNSLYDLADGSEDVMENIEKNWQQMVNHMVINNLIGEKLRESLSEWYDQLGELNKERTKEGSTMTDAEYKRRLGELQSLYQSYVQEGADQIEQFRDMGIIKSVKDTAEEATDETKGYLDTIKSAFEELVSDSETDIEEWGKNLRNAILQNLIQSKLLDDAFEKWAEDWGNKYADLISRMSEGAISQSEFDRQLSVLMAEFDDTTGDISDKSKAMWEAFGFSAEEAAEEAKKAFEDLHGSFLSTLTDRNGDVEAWSRNITKTMVEQLVERNILNDAFDGQMDEWRARFESALQAGDTDGLKALRKELEDLRESLAVQAKEYMETMGYVEDIISDTTFKDMNGDFKNQLMNLDGTAEDWAESVGRKMAEKIVDQMVSSTMIQPFLDELQKAFNAAMSVEGATISSVLTALTPQIEAAKQAFQQAQPVVHDILAQLGITKEEESKERELPFSDLRSTFVSSLMDMESDAEKFGKEITKTLIEQMIDAQLKQQFQEKLDELNNAWADALENGDSQAIERIRQQMVQLRESATEAVKPLLDDLKALEDVVDEDDTPLHNLRSSFLSDLMSLEDSTEDFADNINKILTEAFVDKFVLGKAFDEQLEKWEKRYADIMEADIDEADRAKQLQDLQQSIGVAREHYTEQARAIQELMGYTNKEALADQEAHVNMADKATYDQFELYLGIATAQQIALEQGNDVRRQILTTLQTMSGITSPNGDTVKEIRSMLRTTNEHLYAIKTATEGIRAEFMPRLQSIDNKLSKL